MAPIGSDVGMLGPHLAELFGLRGVALLGGEGMPLREGFETPKPHVLSNVFLLPLEPCNHKNYEPLASAPAATPAASILYHGL